MRLKAKVDLLSKGPAVRTFIKLKPIRNITVKCKPCKVNWGATTAWTRASCVGVFEHISPFTFDLLKPLAQTDLLRASVRVGDHHGHLLRVFFVPVEGNPPELLPLVERGTQLVCKLLIAGYALQTAFVRRDSITLHDHVVQAITRALLAVKEQVTGRIFCLNTIEDDMRGCYNVYLPPHIAWGFRHPTAFTNTLGILSPAMCIAFFHPDDLIHFPSSGSQHIFVARAGKGVWDTCPWPRGWPLRACHIDGQTGDGFNDFVEDFIAITLR